MEKKSPSKSPRKIAKKSLRKKVATPKKRTQVIVKYDCGLDSSLFIRGQGAGLSWHHGTPLKNIKNDEWSFEVQLPEEEFEFKVLVNDQVFETGDNHKAESGQKIVINPKFS